MKTRTPRVTIVIPSLDGNRGGKLAALLRSLKCQTFQDFEVRLMLNDPRQGRAINAAVREGRGDIIVTMDDDTELGHAKILENLVRALDEDPTIGIAGASTIPGPSATGFQRRACKQIPRRYFPVVDRTVESDMVQHPCLAMHRSVFEEVGGEDEELIRGLDPLLRHKVRRAGYRVVIVPFTWVSHPLPERLWKIVRMYFRNGRGSAFACRLFPDRIYELNDGRPGAGFAAQRPLWYRALRFPVRMAASMARGHLVKLSAEAGYLCGYLWEYFIARRRTAPATRSGKMVTFGTPDRLPESSAELQLV